MGENFLTNHNVTILDIVPVTILPGVIVGNNAVIAAGVVVTKNAPDNCIVGGMLAKVIREFENDV